MADKNTERYLSTGELMDITQRLAQHGLPAHGQGDAEPHGRKCSPIPDKSGRNVAGKPRRSCRE